jgi:hypothetical protein
LRAERDVSIDTPLGPVRAEAVGTLQHIALTLSGRVQPDSVRFFYYSEGAIRAFRR